MKKLAKLILTEQADNSYDLKYVNTSLRDLHDMILVLIKEIKKETGKSYTTIFFAIGELIKLEMLAEAQE